MANRSLGVGVVLGVVAVGLLWLGAGAFGGRYQLSTGTRGVYLLDTRTGQVWVRTDLPPRWETLGKP